MTVVLEYMSEKGWNALDKAVTEKGTESYDKANRLYLIRIEVMEKYDVINFKQHDLILDEPLRKEFLELINYFNNL
jgi:hypothetical protein